MYNVTFDVKDKDNNALGSDIFVSEFEQDLLQGTLTDVELVDGKLQLILPALTVAEAHTLQTSASATYSHSYVNPVEGDLILITCHSRGAFITAISYGGVTPTLIAESGHGSEDEWPQTYIYAISKNNQPATGQSHTLSVSWSSSYAGATSFTKITDVADSVINDLSSIVSAATYNPNSTSISTDITPVGNSFIFDAVTFRNDASADPDDGQTQQFYGAFASPRYAGASYKIDSGETSMGWSGASLGNRIRHVVASIELDYVFGQGTRISEPADLSAYGVSNPDLKIKWKGNVGIETAVTDSDTVEPSEQEWEAQINGGSLTNNLNFDLSGYYLWIKTIVQLGESLYALGIYEGDPFAVVKVDFNNEFKDVDATGQVAFENVSVANDIPYTVYAMTLKSVNISGEDYDYTYETDGAIDVVDQDVTEAVIIGPEIEQIWDNQEFGTNIIGRLWTNGVFELAGFGEVTNFSWDGSPIRQDGRIKSLIVEEGITLIGSYVFSMCVNLATINLPDSIEHLNNSCFYDCSISEFVPPILLQGVWHQTFFRNNLREITLYENITYSIYGESFSNNPFTIGVTINSNVDVEGSVGDFSPFRNCNLADRVTIGPSVTILPMNLLGGCGLTTITLPEALESIGGYCFSGHHFIELTIPANVSSIGESAFWVGWGTDGKTETIYNHYNGNQTLGSGAFNGIGKDLVSGKVAHCYSANTNFVTAIEAEGYTVYYIDAEPVSLNTPLVEASAESINPSATFKLVSLNAVVLGATADVAEPNLLIASYDYEDYVEWVKGPVREINAEIEIEFPEGTVLFTGDDIMNMNLLKESSAVGGNPLGFVASNELTISLNNADRRFTPSNPDRVYTVKPGLKISPFLTIKLPDGPDARIPLGVYWCGDWDTPSNTIVASTVCHDRLINILNIDTPQIPPMTDTYIAEMFGELFRKIGLSPHDYMISAGLTQPIRVGWFPRESVGASLQLLSEAGNCFVTTNRDNQIVVRPNLTDRNAVDTYTDDDMLFSVNNPQRINDIFSAVKVGYRLPYLKEPNVQLVRADRILIPTGTTTLDRIDFNADDIPIMQINWVHLFNNRWARVVTGGISFGATDISLVVENSNVPEEVDLQVEGIGTGHHKAHRVAVNQSAVDMVGHLELFLENPLIQQHTIAQDYADKVLEYVSDPLAVFTIDWRGDPLREIGDILYIQSATDKIPLTKIIVHKIELRYDGGLTGFMEGRKTSW